MNDKPNYTEVDAELLAQIQAGNNRAKLLCGQARLLKKVEPFCSHESPDWRVIDRRLQALRKKGVIRHDGKVWELVRD